MNIIGCSNHRMRTLELSKPHSGKTPVFFVSQLNELMIKSNVKITVRRDDVVVGLFQHRVVVVEGQVLREQLMSQLVHSKQSLKFL